MSDEAKAVYRYFSHHIRNSTALIATGVTLLSYKLSDDNDNLVSDVVEASYLLDLFDAGMGICMGHFFDDEQPSLLDEYNIGSSVLHFFEQIKGLVNEKSICLNVNLENAASVEASVFVLRTMTTLILYEIFLQTEKEMSVKVLGSRLHATSDAFAQAPKVWAAFKQVLSRHRVSFSYDDKGCQLEYAG